MDQLLREWPPGFGGIERVAHTLAIEKGGEVFAFSTNQELNDPFPVSYIRRSIPSIYIGKFIIPLPSWNLLRIIFSKRPFLAHLPCPTVLIIVLISRLFRPNRFIKIYWHAFIEPRGGFFGFLESIYQFIALKIIRNFQIFSTSPIVTKALEAEDIPINNINCLPCALTSEVEDSYELIWEERKQTHTINGTLIVIGRLDSYKRVDWLIKELPCIRSAKRLIVVGDGSYRSSLEDLAEKSLRSDQEVSFYGRVDESYKRKLLSQSDILILPSDRSNEAFGIVQLEAMACGIPAISFFRPRSGMNWVSHLSGIGWTGKPNDLQEILQKLLVDVEFYRLASEEARERYLKKFSISLWKKRLSDFGYR